MGNLTSVVRQALGSEGRKPLNEFMAVCDPETSSDEMMSAVIYCRHGIVDDCLELVGNLSRPVPSPGQVLVKVHAYGINPLDVVLLDNPNHEFLVPLPKVIGCDFSGTVISTSELPDEKKESSAANDDRLRVGDKVIGLMPRMCSQWGSAAEFVAIDANLCAKINTRSIDLIEAAGLPLVGLTVYQGLQPFVKHCAGSAEWPGPGSGVVQSPLMGTPNEYTRLKRVLILDGQGGLGTMAVQYCKQVLGMYVIAAANSTKSDCVKKLGADEVIDLSAVSTELIHPVDLVFDTRHGTFESCTDHSNMVTNGGWYLNVLSSPNTNKHAEQRGSLQLFLPDMQLYPLQFVSRLIHTQWNKLCQYFLSFSSPSLNEVVTHYRYICVHPNQTDLKELVAIMKAYQLRTVIDRVFPMTLEKVHAAHNYVASGTACGKVIIRVQSHSHF